MFTFYTTYFRDYCIFATDELAHTVSFKTDVFIKFTETEIRSLAEQLSKELPVWKYNKSYRNFLIEKITDFRDKTIGLLIDGKRLITDDGMQTVREVLSEKILECQRKADEIIKSSETAGPEEFQGIPEI